MEKAILACLAIALTAGAALADESLSQRFSGLTRSTRWIEADRVPLAFDAHHPQGLVKIGEAFYLSSVEISNWPTPYPLPIQGLDRSAGRGTGHLYRFDAKGRLTGEVTLGEGDAFHPGGIDYDGKWIWVPVAEYRPNSATLVYRVDPTSLKAELVFRFKDHLGGLVHDRASHTLHAVNWGSRRFYAWPLDERDRPDSPAHPQSAPNHAHYIDYQDCHSVAPGAMVCGGLTNYATPAGKLSLGGLEWVDLTTQRATHQVPVPLWAASGRPMTQNPFFMEKTADGLRFYLAPDDDQTTLYVYDVRP